MRKTRFFTFMIVVALSLVMVGIAVAKDSTPPTNAGITGVSVDYGWSQATGTYTEIAGGTQVTTLCDDQSYNAYTIPFSFTFNGVAYTSFSIQCNGFIAMGPTVSTSYTPISSGSSNNIIVALGADQQTNLADSEIRYEVLGTSPDQVLVVQWKNFRQYGATGDLYNFQIRLYETSNLVEVVYGPFTQNASNRTIQVGLRGNTSADFNNRTGTTDWLSSTAGTVNSATMALTSTYYPPSGLTWTWTPLPPHPAFSTSYKTAPSQVVIGDAIAYTIHIINSGNADAVATLMVDPLPIGTVYNNDVVCSAGTCAYNSELNQVEWEGTVPVLADITVSFSVIADDVACGLPIINEATLEDPSLVGGPVTVTASTKAVASAPTPLDGFEVSVPPPGWTETIIFDPGTDPDWSQVSAGTSPTILPHGGAYMAKFNSYSTGLNGSALLATNALDLTGYASPQVVFWMSHDTGYASNADRIQIQVSTDGLTWTNVGDPVMRYDATCSTACWKEHVVSLAGYNLSTVYIGFLGVSAYGNNIFLDDTALADFNYPCAGPEIDVSPLNLSQTLVPDSQATQPLNICNTGDAPLTWDLAEVPGLKITNVVNTPSTANQPGRSVELKVSDHPTSGMLTSVPAIPQAAVPLALDDGGWENAIGVNDATSAYQFIWLNRFTPSPSDLPFNLNQIQVLFPPYGVNIGDAIDLVVYQDADGNPANGAELLATYNVVAQAADGTTWSVYDLPGSLYITGPGDVLIGVIDRFVVSGVSPANWPAAIDQGVSQLRSWIGWWNADPPDPAILPPDLTFDLVDNAGFAGNWLIRGLGETIVQDIPWLSETPTSGTLAGGNCTSVAVTFDSTGLALGAYFGGLQITSNDLDEPSVDVPVVLTVGAEGTPIFDQSSKLAPAEVNDGEAIHYTIVVNNTGLSPSLSTTVTDLVPAGTSFVPGSLTCDSGDCSYDGGTDTVNWAGQVGAGGLKNEHGAGVNDITGSTVNFIDPETFPPSGVTTDLCFNVTETSPDEEYLDGFDFDLPDDWTVNSVIDVSGNGCGIGHTFGVNPGNQVYWYTNGMPSECGDWLPGTYDFCANVTVPAGCTTGWDFPWNIWGDNYGVPPNLISGTIAGSCSEDQLPNPVTIEFDVIADACPLTVENTAVIDDPAIAAPVEVTASTDVVCQGEPDISVTPLALDETLFPDEQATQPLNVCNVGATDLEWNIVEAAGAKQLNTVLWDNGPLITNPGGGAGGADASVLQTNLTLSTYGFGHQFTLGYWVADDFEVTGASGWDLSSIKFYAYQTNSGTTPTITGVYYQILDGAPNAGGTVVCGDMVTNRMTNTMWPNMYRVVDYDILNTARPPMEDTVSIATGCEHLDPGMYWIMWSTNGTLASGPWAPPVSIIGETTTGNGLQSLDFGATWADAIDTGSLTPQGLPFIIEGSGGGFDIPWLSETPTSGTLIPGECQAVDVTFDSTGLAPDTYTGALAVNSNDPDEPTITVPVTLTVESQAVGPVIVVTPPALDATVVVDGSLTLPLNITNEGDADLIWSLCDGICLPGWSDNFDSYATGSQMHGQGGWKGWFNNPAAGALTTDVQAHSSPNSVAGLGATDLVHEYSGYTSGTWTYTAWQYVPTNFSGQSYFIMLNQYSDSGTPLNWSVQVYVDGATNQVVNFGATGGTLPLIKGSWVEMRVVIDLDNDVQSFYYDNDLLYTATWTTEQGVGGILNIAAVDLFANSASVVYYDDISLGQFEDTPWLSENPTSGTTTPGASTPVAVTFDATGLAVGDYTTNLYAFSNDPANPVVTVPVTMTVVEASADLSLVKDYYPVDVMVGETFTYTLDVTNNGPQAATNVVLVDTLPAEVTFVSAESCTETGGVVTCTLANLPSGESMVFSIVVTANAVGTAVNTANVTSDVFDPDLSDNTSTVETPIFSPFTRIFLPIIQKP